MGALSEEDGGKDKRKKDGQRGMEQKKSEGRKNVALVAVSDSSEGPALSLSLSPPIQPAPPLVTSNGVAGATAPHVADGEMVAGGRGRF